MNILSRSYVFYPVLVLCLGLDIVSCFVFSGPVLCLLLCLYAVAVSHKIGMVRLISLLLFIALESFFFCGQWGIQLLYLIPLSLMAKRTWDTFSSPVYHAIFVLFLSLSGQFFLDLLLGTHSGFVFTILKYFINIMVTMILSLTYI